MRRPSQLVRELADGGALVVAVLHQLEEAAAFADRVLVLRDGGVIADGPAESALTSATIECAYGVSAAPLEFHQHLCGDALHAVVQECA